MWQKHKVSKCCWKNGDDRLAQCRVATNLQFIKKKNTVSVKCFKVKHNKMKNMLVFCSDEDWFTETKSPVYILGFSFFLRFYLFTFRETGREGEREVEKHQCVRDVGCLSQGKGPGLHPRHGPWLGTELATFWVHRLALSPLSHTSQG